MRTETTKRTGTLVSSAVLAAVCCGTIATPAWADAPDDIQVDAVQFDDAYGPESPWDFIQGLHTFGTTDTFDSGYAPGFGYEVDVTSGSTGPDSYYMLFDWSAFDLPYGIGYDADLLFFTLNLYPVDERTGEGTDIDSISITTSVGGPDMADISGLTETDGLVEFQANAQTVEDNGGLIVVEWSTKAIPAPGALALLGMAGFVGSRRRRRN